MMKQAILSDISGKLAALGILFQSGVGSDIAVSAEFLDAGWSTGRKKINYEAFVFADESKQTLFLYEKTAEQGSGFSFGGGSESFSQTGTTLFRKVKSIQYGPDGKAYEYTIDLGAIPKAVKETAKQYGWSFKTVLSKNKAMYPQGSVPPTAFAAANAAVPSQTAQPTKQQPQVQPQPEPANQQPQAQSVNQQPAAQPRFCTYCGSALTKGAAFCVICGKPVVGAARP